MGVNVGVNVGVRVGASVAIGVGRLVENGKNPLFQTKSAVVPRCPLAAVRALEGSCATLLNTRRSEHGDAPVKLTFVKR